MVWTLLFTRVCASPRNLSPDHFSSRQVGVWQETCYYFQFGTAKYYKYYYFVCSDQEVQICSCEVYIPIYHPLFDCLQYKNWKVRRHRVETSYKVLVLCIVKKFMLQVYTNMQEHVKKSHVTLERVHFVRVDFSNSTPGHVASIKCTSA